MLCKALRIVLNYCTFNESISLEVICDIHFTGNPNMLVYQIMVIHQIFKPTLQRLLRSVV